MKLKSSVLCCGLALIAAAAQGETVQPQEGKAKVVAGKSATTAKQQNFAPSNGGPLWPGISSDEVAWEHFANIMSAATANAVEFETWASDEDIYETTPPVWPNTTQAVVKHLHPGLLQRGLMAHPTTRLQAIAPGTSCGQVSDAAAGNFPTTPSGTQQPCYAEEVRRNRPSFDYIVSNGLYSTAGLAAWAQKGLPVALPWSAIEVKADWVPLVTIVQWLGMNGKNITEDEARKVYYTTVYQNVTYGLVGVHISSKETPNWVWATFEHQYNPGRCDTMGCYDSFGSVKTKVPPNTQQSNTQYPTCTKTAALNSMFAMHHLPAVWGNYCLKASQIAFTTPEGIPLVDGNSFTERVAAGVPIQSASCISCHASASFDKNGAPYTTILQTNPIGNVSLPSGIVANDFIWGVLLAK